MARATKPVREYWDACLFLDLVNKTKDRIAVLAAMYDDLLGESPKAEAITSVLSIAEVAFGAQEKDVAKLDATTLARIDGLWAPPPDSPILLVEFYDGIARDARDMIREAVAAGLTLKAHDAIHFATARRWKAVRFWTYDQRLYKFDKRWGFSVEAPKTDALPLGVPNEEAKSKTSVPSPADGGASAGSADEGESGKSAEDPAKETKAPDDPPPPQSESVAVPARQEAAKKGAPPKAATPPAPNPEPNGKQGVTEAPPAASGSPSGAFGRPQLDAPELSDAQRAELNKPAQVDRCFPNLDDRDLG